MIEKALVVQEPRQRYNLAPRNYQEASQAAERYSRSTLVPQIFRGKPDDCFIMVQLAARQNVDPFMLMQNSYVVHGTPGVMGKYAIGMMNVKGPFKGGVQFKYEGAGDSRKCTAWAIHKDTGEKCEQTVGYQMAKAEGWVKNPKWQTMTDLMLAYRSGAFLARLYCPEVLMGMQTAEELEDIIDVTAESREVEVGLSVEELEDIEYAMAGEAEAGTLPEYWKKNNWEWMRRASEAQMVKLIGLKDELKADRPEAPPPEEKPKAKRGRPPKNQAEPPEVGGVPPSQPDPEAPPIIDLPESHNTLIAKGGGYASAFRELEKAYAGLNQDNPKLVMDCWGWGSKEWGQITDVDDMELKAIGTLKRYFFEKALAEGYPQG